VSLDLGAKAPQNIVRTLQRSRSCIDPGIAPGRYGIPGGVSFRVGVEARDASVQQPCALSSRKLKDFGSHGFDGLRHGYVLWMPAAKGKACHNIPGISGSQKWARRALAQAVRARKRIVAAC
jgi:hypothetical protein